MAFVAQRNTESQPFGRREGEKSSLFLRYYLALIAFSVGALYFYLRLRVKTLGSPREKVTTIARKEIAEGSALLFRVLKRMGLVEVTLLPDGAVEETVEETVEELKRANQVIVANHPSILDALLLLSHVPNGVCIMKRALLKVPVIAGFAKCAGYVPYSDPSELLSAAVNALREGGTLIIFPEGTRSSASGLAPLHRGAARIALEAQAPLSVYGMHMAPVVLGREAPWWRAPSSRVRYTISKLQTISPGSVETLLPEDIRNRSIELTKRVEDTLLGWYQERLS